MLVRFLQHFSSITLDLDACPPESRPPAAWAKAPGRKSIEKLWPKIHLTMYTHVSGSHGEVRSFDFLTGGFFLKGGLWVKMHEADNSA